MSRPNNLINDEESIFTYLEKIRKLPYVIDLYLIGSRMRGTHKDYSDWDIFVHTKFPVDNFNKVYGKVEGYNIDFAVGVEYDSEKKLI